MLHTTKGIVIHHFKYSERSVIAKVYTEKFGLQSYILNGTRSAKSKNKAVYLQPLSLVEINAFHKETNGLQRVKNIQLDIPFQSIPFNINKSSIAFFMAEVLYKSIKEEEPNEGLFEYLHNGIQVLDLTPDHYANFHLLFMAQLSKHLGFYPAFNAVNQNAPFYFDLQEGCFLNIAPHHKAHINAQDSPAFMALFGTNFDAMSGLILNATQRKVLLTHVLNYYSLHLSNFDSLKTLDILEEVLN